jgi:hypothetical protein
MKPQQIKFELTESGNGMYLTIWEPSKDHTQRYQYIANYPVKDAFEAEKILRHFYRTNQFIP